MTAPPTSPDGEIDAARGEAVFHLRALQLDGPARELADALISVLERDDLAELMASLRTLRGDVEAVHGQLEAVYQRLSAAERARAEAEPLGETWWHSQRQDLHELVDETAHREQWARMWTAALVGNRPELCDRIADLARFPAEQALRPHLRALSAALAGQLAEDAQQALAEVLTDGPAQLPVDVAVPLSVLRARIELTWILDVAAAQRSAEVAVTVADAGGSADDRTLGHSALAEVMIATGDLAEAKVQLGIALPLAESRPDALVAAGSIAEREAAWTRANEYYDAAVRRFGVRVADSELLRPVPALLLWRLARGLRHQQPERALAVLDEAIAKGITGKGKQPDRTARVDRAVLLHGLGRAEEAAEAYLEAGDRYLQSGSTARAISLYRRACREAPQNPHLWWIYADALRGHATDSDWILDRELAVEALAALHRGLALRQPGPEDAWVLGTEALLAMALRGSGDDPALIVERALLLDPKYNRAYVLLAAALLADGYPTEAAAAARTAVDRDRNDPFAVDHLASALSELGRYDEALHVVNRYLARPGSSPELVPRRAKLHLRLGQPQAALDALRTAPVSDIVLAMRVLCHDATGYSDESTSLIKSMWDDRATATSSRLTAWAARRLRCYTDAIDLLEGVRARATTDHALELDLGLARVLRGDPDLGDLDAGAHGLRSAVESAHSAEDLVQLVQSELPTARPDLDGHPRRELVLAILDDVERRARARWAELRTATRSVTEPAAVAAAARTALDDDRPTVAVDRYLRLLDTQQIAEAYRGLRRATLAQRAVGDRYLRHEGDLAMADRAWAIALRGGRELMPHDAQLVASLLTRSALARLERGEATAAARMAEALQTADGDAHPLTEAVALFARDVKSTWTHRTGLHDLAENPELTARDREILRSAGDATPFDAGYAPGRHAVPTERVFPLVTPVEIRLGRQHRELAQSSDLGDAIRALRERLTMRTGVRIPGVRIAPVGPGTEISKPDEVTFRIYDQLVARVQVATHPQRRLSGLMSPLEQITCANLFRLIGPDDVGLWLGGWGGTADADLDWTPPDAATRLRLVRVLRLLLREGISIRDRKTIIDSFRATDPTSDGPLDTFQVVRRCLLPLASTSYEGTVSRALPAALEKRALAGLTPGPELSWEMERDRATSVLDDLRTWRKDLPADVVVTVRDPRLRPFVWRLLAFTGSGSAVLAAEELT